MKRRTFIKSSSLLALPGFVGGVPVSAIANSSLSTVVNGDNDRVLILIQLGGGNDGLATIIPRDQQDNLAAVRSNILIPETEFINVTDTIAFHPNMTGMKELWDDAKINIIQSAGYPDQNRSHFRSSDIWHSGSAADEFLTTGWMGRYFDSKYADFPASYPNEDCPDPFAITVGSIVSETCQGFGGNFSMALVDPENLNQLATPTNNEMADGCSADKLEFLINSFLQSNKYSEVIQEAYDNGANISTKYPDDNGLANQLKTVARLISGGLRTKVFVVSLGGFDTHANQTVEGDPTTGEHAVLLQTLSDAICAFQDDINSLGLAQRVLGMTYSEFGRRIRSNFSLGTDHGTAAPLILFGSCVNAGIIGDNPTISPDAAIDEGIPMQYDFRSIYGSVLMDWFELEETEVEALFSHDFQYIPVANTCETVVNTNNILQDEVKLNAYPNPFADQFTIEFESENEWVKISIFDAIGSEVKVLVNKTINAGQHQMIFNTNELANGAYFVRLQTKLTQKTVRVIKLKK